MLLTRFSNNLPDVVKRTFQICFSNTQNNRPTTNTRMKKIRLFHSNNEFSFAHKIHEYCKADVAFLQSGCMKCMVSFMETPEFVFFGIIATALYKYFALLTIGYTYTVVTRT